MAAESFDDLVRQGREALAAADWPRARSCLTRAAGVQATAEVLDGLGQAAHFLAAYQDAIRFKERAARAERLLEGVEASVEHGRLALDRAAWTDDPLVRERHARSALEMAGRFGDRDLEFAAQAVLGHAYVVSGRVEEGMSLIDEAMAAVAGGEVSDIEAVGSIYCRLLGACERTTDVRRAEDWIAAARRFVAWGDFVTPTCRLHYGGILMAVGRWAEAEQELLAAARVFDGGYRGMRAAPLLRLAALRVRQGRLEEAERLLEGCESRPAARRLLAEIALARGDLALAEDRARLCLEAEEPASLACAPLLELLVQIRLARGDLDAAGEALERLAALASAAGDERTTAAVELARGRLRVAMSDERGRLHLQAALDAFSALELPLVVTGFNSFFIANDMVAALCEARRVARDGGIVAMTVFGRPDRCQSTGVFAPLARFSPARPDDGDRTEGTEEPALHQEGVLEAMATEAGLTPKEAGYVTVAEHYPDLETMVRGYAASAPFVRAARAAGEEAVRQALREVLRPLRLPTGEYRLEDELRSLIAMA